MNDATPKAAPSRLVHLYKRRTLVMLLMRRLGREEAEDATTEQLDEIWWRMTEAEREQVDVGWGHHLPESLRGNGPDVQDDWERGSGLVECSICGLSYYDHPTDPREKFPLHVGCDGRRWKL